MNELIEKVSFILSFIALIVLSTVVLVNLYLIKRNGFYVNANCWFCNTWCKVLYSDKNSFECPSCNQYNGFDEDGGYNKEILEQHTYTQYKASPKDKKAPSNGLCNYCNNNQQLKIIQLARFVPLDEDNYDNEVEHFQKQLEKAYKLCKKCDIVLKQTIDSQKRWVFGTRMRHLKNKGLHLLDLNSSFQGISREFKQNFIIKSIHYTLVLFLIIILTNSVFVKTKLTPNSLKTYIPDIFLPYYVLVSDTYKAITHQFENMAAQSDAKDFLPQNITFKSNNLIPITTVGFLLHICLIVFENKPPISKICHFMGWTILLVTSWINFPGQYFAYINTLQGICSFVQIYLLCKPVTESRKPVKIGLKKMTHSVTPQEIEDSDSEDLEFENHSNSSFVSTKSKLTNQDTSLFKNELNNSWTKRNQSLQNTTASVNLNNSFMTAKSVFSDKQSLHNSSLRDSDLNRSLDNLSLDNLELRPRDCTSPVYSLNAFGSPRPILSPPKFKNCTQNSWIAGGFWRNADGVIMPHNEFAQASRSSSQSSGFISQHNDQILRDPPYHSLPGSRNNSVCGDYDRSSIISEPAYHFTPINPPTYPSHSNLRPSCSAFTQKPMNLDSSQLYYKSENTFYPVLNQNSMLYIHDKSQNCNNLDNTFTNLSMRTPVCNNYNTSPSQPVRSFANSSRDYMTPILFNNLTYTNSNGLFKNNLSSPRSSM